VRVNNANKMKSFNSNNHQAIKWINRSRKWEWKWIIRWFAFYFVFSLLFQFHWNIVFWNLFSCFYHFKTINTFCFKPAFIFSVWTKKSSEWKILICYQWYLIFWRTQWPVVLIS
jgi:hypothetical protein